MTTVLDERTWLDVNQAAERSGYHWRTIADSLREQSLHGTQRKPRGRWRIHRACLDAWLAGEKCPHQLAETG